MKWSLGQFLSQITGFWKSQSKKNKILIVSLTAGLVVVASVVAALMNNSGYVPLYSGLSTSEAGEVMVRLGEMGVDFKTQSGGVILVPKEEESRLHMTLASEGYPKSTLNYDLFSTNAGFMTTDYEKKKYLLFQLQNRLQDAIKTIKGIKGAIVTISLPEEDSFVLREDKIAPTASVILDMDPSLELTNQQIKGIEALVSKSVPGLEGKNVAIVSSSGDMVNNQHADGSEGVAYTKLELERTISAAIETKVAKLLAPIFGPSGARIAVSTLVDINKKISEQTTYTPVVDNAGVIQTQDTSRETTTAGGPGVGGVPGTGTNTDVITYPQVNGVTSSSESETSSTDYLNNQIKEQIQREGYEVLDTTVSVLVNAKSLNEEEKLQYRQMVAFAAGISADKVAITNADFTALNIPFPDLSPEGEPGAESFLAGPGKYYAAAGGALLFLLLILLFLRGAKKKKDRERAEEEALLKAAEGLKPLSALGIAEEIVNNETREQNLKRQIKDFAKASPDIVAQMIRTWLREENDYE